MFGVGLHSDDGIGTGVQPLPPNSNRQTKDKLAPGNYEVCRSSTTHFKVSFAWRLLIRPKWRRKKSLNSSSTYCEEIVEQGRNLMSLNMFPLIFLSLKVKGSSSDQNQERLAQQGSFKGSGPNRKAEDWGHSLKATELEDINPSRIWGNPSL